MFIDTHAHLNYPDIAKNIDDVLSRAMDSGVEAIVVPATTYKTSIEIVELVQKHKILYAAVGIHPTELKDFDESHLSRIEVLAKENKVVAIGEIGLDYYWEPFDRELEILVLTEQLRIAKRTGLPVILHNRKSTDDLMRIVKDEFEEGKLKGQFHSFSAGPEEARQCVEMGFYISFTGNITYKPNEGTLIAYDIVKQTGAEHLLLETDTPYLPPVPYRGKQNEPSYIKHTAAKIAELKEMNVEELGRITTLNAKRLYGI
ncbi:MAG TPA: TatD family hydrolase [Ignavibacteria bacterium]|nr:TatD family hydrolase [Ignavibacteria bacterium]HMQ98801.1 TatD family hydrolase [Ignavibacteria bacterium]